MTLYSEATEGEATRTHTWIQASFRCNHCQKLSIGSTIVSNHTAAPIGLSHRWWDSREIHWTPSVLGGREFPDVPVHIASAADEAFRCRSADNLRSAILLARSVLEAACKDQKFTEGTLASKIDSMTAAGLIREFTRDAAHELRFVGNEMAHGDFIEDVDAETADEVLEVMAEILNEVYQSPARIIRMKAKRHASRQKEETASPGPSPSSGADFTGTLRI